MSEDLQTREQMLRGLMREHRNEIFETGKRAFNAGLRLKDNSYPKGSDDHKAFEEGWRWASAFKKSAQR